MEETIKVMSQEQMIFALEQKGVDVVGPSEGFQGTKGGIWISAESTPSLFNYWSGMWADTFGVQPALNDFVEETGWYFEWYDPGTMFAWEI